MRKIIMQMSVSLDGYFEGPDREIDWHLVDEELHLHMNERLKVMGGFLSGRVSHELMAAYWPTADADPQSSPAVAEFAGIWRDMPKFVYSRTLERADWNATIVRDVVAEEVRELKARPGGDLVLGGAGLAASFLRLGLVDEFRIYVHPVLLGRGRTPFPDAGTLTALRRTGTRTFGNGVVLLQYERADADADDGGDGNARPGR
ncbi:dihydrofolate reductase family protein [Actinacidiphila glaucinigra]|uniref:dihydrofolate reductase family protein n=1 Tax=Actinacidiphila glaucinigra TaxID=235986 RepID=UPI002DDC47CB|nr:dihydrofolate reductase family protein [Actinacidiphila glaucinigra]WSD64146.1 dihydrofolate reductase family protein [Actinacidiphila glaucinigra]